MCSAAFAYDHSIQLLQRYNMKTMPCSICGNEKSLSEFDYGNRKNRSYCADCHRTDQRIYQGEGLKAVHKWRAEMRKSWK